MLSVVILAVVMLTVVMLSVVAPQKDWAQTNDLILLDILNKFGAKAFGRKSFCRRTFCLYTKYKNLLITLA
jgi:hypothetical protein